MKDYIWDSHLELVREFAPVELKDFGIIWLNPTNVGSRVDILEELNSYFLTVVDALDNAIKTDNEEEQNVLAIFLDDRLTEIVDTWLDGKEQYRIYPKADQSPDTFSPTRIYEIMRLIMEEPVAPVVTPEEPAPVVTPEELPAPAPEEPPAPAPEEPPPETVKEALARRRSTRKNRPKGKPKTRKRKAVAPKTS
jgi:outer membrane biosynthesis protein TonB